MLLATQAEQIAQAFSSRDVDFDCSTVFLSPNGGFLACGIGCIGKTALPHSALLRERDRLLNFASQEGLPPIVFGAISFYDDGASQLCLPRDVIPIDRTAADWAGCWNGPDVPHGHLEQGDRAREVYCDGVRHLLEQMGTRELEKAVLARTARAQFHHPPAPGDILLRLLARYPQSYVFCVPVMHGGEEDRSFLIGASPELLVKKHGSVVVSNPLAGTAPSSGRGACHSLMQSHKDRREHAVTCVNVANKLRPYCSDLHVPQAPSVLEAGPVVHLSSLIHGTLTDARVPSLELALALHPTPAVGGFPQATALSLIRRLEPFDRGLYAGAVGWCDGNGDGEWAVTLRCAKLGGAGACFYAGAGIVKGSEPELEWLETQAKLKTMLEIFNVQG